MSEFINISEWVCYKRSKYNKLLMHSDEWKRNTYSFFPLENHYSTLYSEHFNLEKCTRLRIIRGFM